MDESRIVILGAHGQLGKALQAVFPRATAFGHDQLDAADWHKLQSHDWSRTDMIINAAAYTNVDGAETADGRHAAWQTNAVAAGNLARIATAHNLTLVHISSDYVFDGTVNMHPETEPFSPLGVYGQTKAAGDIAVATTPKHYILRTTWLVGDGPNFVRVMAGLAARHVSPTVVGDQIGRLTFTTQLAEIIRHLLTTGAQFGTYNATNDGEPASWADITRAIFTELNRPDLTVTDTSTADYFASKPTAALRPLQSTLDLAKLKTTGIQLRDWRADLTRYVKDGLAA